MAVGTNIKRRRLELRMSQQELAEAMGYQTRSTIAKIESGENDVSQKKLQKFASILDTTVEALIFGGPAAQAMPSVAFPAPPRNREKNIVIILAGGKTALSSQSIPSQFVSIHGKPILVYSMDAYQAHPAVDDIYVVCLKGWESIVKAYAEQYGITKLKGLIPAGSSGIASLKNAVDEISGRYAPDDCVIVQEATRPRVTVETVSSLLQACGEKGSATICHAMKDYLQFRLSEKGTEYIDRDTVIALQSPEAHRLATMQAVFKKAEALGHPMTETCCTMLLYNLGYEINFIESSVNNIKITRDEDIAAFRALLKP